MTLPWEYERWASRPQDCCASLAMWNGFAMQNSSALLIQAALSCTPLRLSVLYDAKPHHVAVKMRFCLRSKDKPFGSYK